MIFSYADDGPTTATMNWQVAIDHDDNAVHLLYWHAANNEWVWLADNYPPGGRDPDVEHTNVMAAFENNGGRIAIFMFTGETPAAADNWIKCDVADITTN